MTPQAFRIDEPTSTGGRRPQALPAAQSLSLTGTPVFHLVAKSSKSHLEVTHFAAVDAVLLDEIDALARLQDDWDGDGGHAPSEETIDAASILAVQLQAAARNRGLTPSTPKVQAAGDGSIGLVWRHPTEDWVLEVEVAEGAASYLANVRGLVHEGVIVTLDDILPLLPKQ